MRSIGSGCGGAADENCGYPMIGGWNFRNVIAERRNMTVACDPSPPDMRSYCNSIVKLTGHRFWAELSDGGVERAANRTAGRRETLCQNVAVQ